MRSNSALSPRPTLSKAKQSRLQKRRRALIRTQRRSLLVESLETRNLLSLPPGPLVGEGEADTNTAVLSRVVEGIGQLQTLGKKIGEAAAVAAPGPKLSGEDLLQTKLDKLAGLDKALGGIAAKITTPAKIVFADGQVSAADPNFNFTSNLAYQISLDGAAPVQLLALVPNPVGSTTLERATRWAASLNASLADVPVGINLVDKLQWALESAGSVAGESAPVLSLSVKRDPATNAPAAGQIQFMTARLEGTVAGVGFGQPTSAVQFEVRNLTLRTLDGQPTATPQTTPPIVIGNLSVTLPKTAPGLDLLKTNDNATLGDLAADINRALAKVEVRFPSTFQGANSEPGTPENPQRANRTLASYLYAAVSRSTGPERILILARDGSVQSFELAGSALPAMGFASVNAVPTNDTTATAYSRLFLRGQTALGDVDRTLFSSVTNSNLVDKIKETILKLDPSVPLSQIVVKADLSEVTFPVKLNSLTHQDVAELNLNRALPIDLLGGTDNLVNFSAQAYALSTSTLTGELMVGISLKGTDGSQTTLASPLADLSDGRGLQPIVGVAAMRPLGAIELTDSVSFKVKIFKPGSSIGKEYTISLNKTATTGNILPNDLVVDLNASIKAQGLEKTLEAKLVDGKLHIRAVDRQIHYLELTADARANVLGFGSVSARYTTLTSRDRPTLGLPTATDRAAYAELVVEFGPVGTSNKYFVNLDRLNTVGEVIAAINAQVPVANFAALQEGRIVLRSSGEFRISEVSTIPSVADPAKNIPLGIRSEAGSGLGILGQSQLSGSVHELRGASLDRQDLVGRVFVKTDGPQTVNVALDLKIGKESAPGEPDTGLDVGIAIGSTQLSGKLPPLDPNAPDPKPVDPLKLTYTLPLILKDPGVGSKQDGRITLDEFLRAEAAQLFQPIVVTCLTASGKLDLVGDVYDLDDVDHKIAKLEFKAGTANDLSSLKFAGDVSEPGTADKSAKFTKLSQLRKVSVLQVIDSIKSVVNTWTAPGSPLSNALHNDLPLVGTSLGEAFDFVYGLNEALDSVISNILPEVLVRVLTQVESRVSNLPLSANITSRIRSALDDVRAEILEFRQLAGNATGLQQQVSQLIAAVEMVAREARRLPGVPAASGEGGEGPDDIVAELLESLDDLKELVPSINEIAEEIVKILRRELPQLDNVQFTIDVLPDTGTDVVLLLGLTFGDQVALTVDPPVASTSLGPLKLKFDNHVEMQATAEARLGLAVKIPIATVSAPEIYVLTNPPTGPGVKTGLDFSLQANRFGISGGVRFGGLDVIGGTLRVATKDSSGTAGTPASLKFGLNGSTADAPLNGLLLSQLDNSDVTASGAGQVSAAADISLLGRSVTDAAKLDFNVSSLTNSGIPPNWSVKETELAGLLSDFDFDLTTIIAGIDAFLEQLSNLMRDELSKLPLVGDELGDVGGYISGFRTTILPVITDVLKASGIRSLEDLDTAITNALYGVLDPAVASNVFKLRDGTDTGSDVSLSDLDVIVERDKLEIKAYVGFKQTLSDGLSFDTKLAGLPLAASGNVGLSLTVDVGAYLGIGVSRSQGVYLIPNPATAAIAIAPGLNLEPNREFAARFSANLGSASALELRLFVLAVTAVDTGTLLDATIQVDLKNGGNYSLLEIDPHFSGSGQVDLKLDLTAKVDDNLPQLTTQLDAGWHINFTDAGINESAAHFVLKNLRLDAGKFLRSIVGGAVGKLKDVLEPISEVIALLETEVPGLSQLSKLADQGPVTLLDLALAEVPRDVASETRRFVNFLKAINDVTSRLNGNGEFVFGDIDFGNKILTPGWNKLPNAAPMGVSVTKPAEFKSLLDKLARKTDEDSPGNSNQGLGLKFPLLDDPSNFIKMLLGQTVDIVTWEIPELKLDFPFSQSFPILPFPPISAEIGLNAGFSLVLGLGFDSRGLQTDNLLDGFYIDDLRDVNGQRVDVDEVAFSLGVSVAALLDVGVASAGIKGEVLGKVSANLRDPNADGKLYGDEIATIIQNDGFGCLFDLKAELRAKLSLVWEVLFWDGTVNIVDLVLLEADNKNSCPTQVAAHVSNGLAETGEEGERKFTNQLPVYIAEALGPTQAPGGLAADGSLILHTGAFANLRVKGKSSDTSEEFTLTRVAPGVVRVTGMGMDQQFGGVQRVIFDGGQGSDKLLLKLGNNGDADSYRQFDIPVFAFGGAGSDLLYGGSLDDKLFGDGGGDTIYAGPGADTIRGGDGLDNLYGDDGNDTIYGDEGDDKIYGEGGADTIFGDDGALTESGQPALGKLGHDTIWGGYDGNVAPPAGRTADAADIIDAGRGNDIVQGGPGNDKILGRGGDDHLYGDADADRIDGGDGHDYIDGGAGDDDWLHGGLGNDFVMGGSGTDQILGGWGNDVLIGDVLASSVGGNTTDTLEGGPDDDFICGTAGANTIHGGTTALGYYGLAGQSLFDKVPFDGVYPVLAGGYSRTEQTSCTTTAPPDPPIPVPGTGLFRVFLDGNNDGDRDSNDPYANGWMVRLTTADSGAFVGEFPTQDIDLNQDGHIDPATERGLIQVAELDPGSYRATVILPALVDDVAEPYKLTSPTTGFRLVTIANGQAQDGGEFGIYEKPVIRGEVWNDLNGNGTRNSLDVGLPGVTVYIDQIPIGGDGTRNLDSDITVEPARVTGPDGKYAFAVDGEPGNYYVRLDDSTNQTFPRPVDAYTNTFAGAVIGPEWSPSRATGSPAGIAFAGEFGNETVTLMLDDLPDHEQLEISFDLYIIGGWQGDIGPNPIDRFRADIVGGATLIDETFANPSEFTQGQTYGRAPGTTALVPPGSGPASITRPLGFTGRPYNGNTAYSFSGSNAFTLSHFGSSITLRFMGLNLEAGKTWGIDTVRIVTSRSGQPVSIPLQGTVTVGSFGRTSSGGNLLGGAPPSSYASVTVGGNSDQSSSWAVDTKQPVTLQVPMAIAPLASPAAAPTPKGFVSGRRFNDLDQDGNLDPGEEAIPYQTVYVDLNGNGQLDDNEPKTKTNGRGEYQFELEVGTYTIREVMPEGWEETAPTSRPFAISQDGKLTEVDPLSGQIVHTRDIQSSVSISQWIGIAYSQIDKVLFAVGNPSSGNSSLFEIDPITATATLRTKLDERLSEGDIAVQPGTGRLLAVTNRGNDFSYLVEIDRVNGRVRDLGTFGGGEFGISPGDPSSMAFTNSANVYVLDRNYGNLYRLDPDTGAVLSPARSTNISNIGRVSGMIWDAQRSRFLLVAGSRNTSFNPADFYPQAYAFPLNTNLTLSPLTNADLGINLSGMTSVENMGHIVTLTADEFSQIAPVLNRNFGNIPAQYIYDGKDHIEGHGGDDKIWGDNVLDIGNALPRVVLIGDDDELVGGDGNDELYGQQKEDTLWGGKSTVAGASTTVGNADKLDGGEGKNLVVQWVDRTQTLLDDTRPTSTTANDARLQGEGAETSLVNIYRARLIAGNTGFTLTASGFSLGSVELIGGPGSDILIGSPQDDRLEGMGGNDTLQGNAGDDVYLFDVDNVLGLDTFTGGTIGDGNDTLDFSATTGVNVTVILGLPALTPQTVAAGKLVLVYTVADTLENLIGGSGNDTLAGNNQANLITGGPGNDTMFGSGANDTFLFYDVLGSTVEEDKVDGGGLEDTLDFSAIDSEQYLLTLDFRADGSSAQPYALTTNLAGQPRRNVIRNSNPTTIERVVGSNGNDIFYDGAGAQTFVGGRGDDLYIFANNDDIDRVEELPDEGTDRVDFSAFPSNRPLRIDLNSTSSFARRNITGIPNIALFNIEATTSNTQSLSRVTSNGDDIEDVIGGAGRDRIYGNEFNNRIDGGPGADKLEGRDGDDTYVYRASTATGADEGSAADVGIIEVAGGGNDWITFGDIEPVLTGMTINLATGQADLGAFDVYWDSGSIENATGGSGNDTLLGSYSNNVLVGGLGNDSLDGLYGTNNLYGGQGDDEYKYREIFAVNIAGQYQFYSDFGSISDPNILLDGRGLPVLDAFGNPQVVDGGKHDRIDLSGLDFAPVVTVNLGPGVLIQHGDARTTPPLAILQRNVLAKNYVVAGQGYLTQIEDVTGSPFNDTITGNDLPNILDGLGGNDILVGLGGNDVLKGGADNNAIYGGRGDDVYKFDWDNASDNTLFEASDTSEGGLVRSDGADTLDFSDAGTSGIFAFDLGFFTDTSKWKTLLGNTTVRLRNTVTTADKQGLGFENLIGRAAASSLTGNEANNVIIGGIGSDTLKGGSGRDILIGAGGTDALLGETGDDILIGGSVNFGTNVDRLAALNTILRAWLEPLSFASRQTAIRAGVGNPALNARLVTSGVGQTVFDDGVTDTHNDSTATDWVIEPPLGAPLATPLVSSMPQRVPPSSSITVPQVPGYPAPPTIPSPKLTTNPNTLGTYANSAAGLSAVVPRLLSASRDAARERWFASPEPSRFITGPKTGKTPQYADDDLIALLAQDVSQLRNDES